MAALQPFENLTRDLTPAPLTLADKYHPPHMVIRRDPVYYPALLAVYFAFALPYLVWRTGIINWEVWHGPLMYLAELYGILTTALFLTMTQRLYVPIYRPARFDKTVDIFVATYTEPLSVLEPTVIGATKVRGARHVLVLDDGNRPEVKAMAERLGVRYCARITNEHAKAGNLNHGLAHSDAEFIMTLDADHIPLPHFLERTLGYFDDPHLAFVQTPQSFYNRESFLFRPRRGKTPWFEQSMFYDVIQVAKNRWNAAFFVGTSAVLRRSALDSIDGFATGTATEDIHTSLRLHARGWRSLFVPEALAYGLEAENLKEFYRQRRRWAAGSLGLLLRSPDSPLWAKGLSFAQRCNYLSATLAHLQGVQKLIFFIVPVAALLTLTGPVTVDTSWYVMVLAVFIAVAVAITAAYARGTYHLLFTEAYGIANMTAHIGGLRGIIKVQKKFSVSRKIVTRNEKTWIKSVFWLMVIVGLLTLLRGAELMLGWEGEPNRSALVVSSSIFAAINLTHLLVFFSTLLAYERREALLQHQTLLATDKYNHIAALSAIPALPGITLSKNAVLESN